MFSLIWYKKIHIALIWMNWVLFSLYLESIRSSSFTLILEDFLFFCKLISMESIWPFGCTIDSYFGRSFVK